jgi:hypothetical protein
MIDPRLTCHHQVFYLPGGGDQTRCQDCGLSATDAVQFQRSRIDELERENAMLRKLRTTDYDAATDDQTALMGRNAHIRAALELAISDMSAMAAELSVPDFGSVIDDYHLELAERLRKIAAALDAAS